MRLQFLSVDFFFSSIKQFLLASFPFLHDELMKGTFIILFRLNICTVFVHNTMQISP